MEDRVPISGDLTPAIPKTPNVIGKSGINRTTQAEIPNLPHHSFPERVNKSRSHIFNGLISGEQVTDLSVC